eukprot:14114375-Ditylum_brightwellii.AAC.1
MEVSDAKSACPKAMEMQMGRLPLISFGVLFFLAFGGLAAAILQRQRSGARYVLQSRRRRKSIFKGVDIPLQSCTRVL